MERLRAGGEIPCHFTTLTTAIYHWQDLAKILENYELAVTQRRQGRTDPLEPSERKLSVERRRVLKYPGVVAWFTGYKMELFYKHVLKYEDGEGVFEWGAGGIMHLHSINFGAQMPRVDHAQDEWRLPCEESVRMAQKFGRVHEEYVTDWSFSKAEKWSEQDIENAAARWTSTASPLHSDAESDGSEDLDLGDANLEPKSKRARVMEEGTQCSQLSRVSFLTTSAVEDRKQQPVQFGLEADVFCQHDLAADADFVRVFPTATSMAYVQDASGRRQVRVLTGSEKKLLQDLDALVVQKDWHPCQIGTKQKALLMTNNCQLVRRMRRKWYRKLAEKCNMHDRHSGVGVEVPPVYVEMSVEEEEAGGRADSRSQISDEVVDLCIGSLNLNMQPLRADVREMISEHDVFCLQEVTPATLPAILTAGRELGYDVVSPAQRGHTTLEGFDVCMLLRKGTVQRLRVGIVPLSTARIRHMLHVQVQVKQNGACLAVATAHCTAGKEDAMQRAAEMEVIWNALEALTVDGCIFAGDTNMHAEERIPHQYQENWEDAWELDGADAASSGTWCQDWMETTHPLVQSWRFDRIFFFGKLFHRDVPQTALPASSQGIAVSSSTVSSSAATLGLAAETNQPTAGGGSAVTFLSGTDTKLDGTSSISDAAVTFLSGSSQQFAGNVSEETARHRGGHGFNSVQMQSVSLVRSSFERIWGVGMSDHASISCRFLVKAGAVVDQLPQAEYLRVVRPGLGTKVARRPAENESCVHKTQSLPFCSKDYEKARMPPGSAVILEDARRKGLYRLYTRRNCHHVNTHDPLKAIGLVANVDDQVVLTIQAAINYLTKYMGKLGTGHTATSRIGGLLDDILCRMQDHETMTVTSLLSKLFIHTAVPGQICSLEAWHILFDFPRVLSSRFFVNLNAKEQPVLKDLQAIQTGTQDTTVTRQTKLDVYTQRLQNANFGTNLTPETVQQMSLAQFVGRVDRRGKKLSLRKKNAIVKEKPYLNLDSRRPNAGDMARYALRLHRPFAAATDDPGVLSDKDAIEQLHTFVESAVCPLWLKQRFRRQNKVKKAKGRRTGDVAFLPVVPDALPAASQAASTGADVAFLPVASGVVPSAGSQAADTGADVAFLPVSSNVASSADTGVDVALLSVASGVVPAAGSQATSTGGQEDTADNRTAVAEQHGFPWVPSHGEMRYSVQEACLGKKPTPKRLQMEKYLEAIVGEKPKKGGSVTDMMQKFVFHMLVFDLASYKKRGAGLVKEGLSKVALQQLCSAHFEYLGSQKPTLKEIKNVKMKLFPDLWEEIKDRTLRECGLTVGHGPRARVALTIGADLTADVKHGQWRNAIYCPHQWRQDDEDLEDPRERVAKRARYVAGAMQEQSMGRPGYNPLHEAQVPLDVDALLCVDKETRSEWDALNPVVTSLNNNALSADLTAAVLPETHVRTLRAAQGGLSHEEASALVAAPPASGAASVTASPSGPRMDPTQQSFVDHMCAWRDAYLSDPTVCSSNLPLSLEKDGPWQLCGPVLLLGTAGTGKTTTVQAANQELEEHGLKGRIVRAAYTGVAASNMGSGARTIVSLFRLKTSRGSGPLQPLSEEEMQGMATELGDMGVLELDELSMIEKLVLAHIHLRLQQWRFECYHPHYCDRSSPCRCGARLPFGGIKVILAGDFGQLPPVAVKDERTLLHGSVQSTGKDSMEVNLGSRLFRGITNVFRLWRIHRQAGASQFKESLLRLRDAARTKEDVALWKTHDMVSRECTFSAEETRAFLKDRVHLFCEKQRAGAFNGRRLGEDATMPGGSGILRVWSVESNPLVERYPCDSFGGLRRVLHFTMGAPVMLISNIRTIWNLVNGLRGRIVGVVWEEEKEVEKGSVFSDGPTTAASRRPQPQPKRDAAEVGGVQASKLKYLIIDFPGYVGPCMIEGPNIRVHWTAADSARAHASVVPHTVSYRIELWHDSAQKPRVDVERRMRL